MRDFLRAEVEPIANEYWARAEFPFQLIDGFRKLDIAGLMYDGAGRPSRHPAAQRFPVPGDRARGPAGEGAFV